MKVTESQLLILLQTTIDTLKIAGANVFTYDAKVREETANAVHNQATEMLTASSTTPLPCCGSMNPNLHFPDCPTLRECDCPPALGAEAHPFESAKHDILCAKCGAGKLHPIHSTSPA